MKLNKNSWYNLLYMKTWGDSLPGNLCPYFWAMLLAVIMLPINFLVTFPIQIIQWITKKKMIYFRNNVYALAIFLDLGLFLFVSMIVMFFPGHSRFAAPGVFGWTFLLIFILAYLYNNYCERNWDKEPKPSIIKEFIKAKYNKYCPKIEWYDKKGTKEEGEGGTVS